MPCYSTIRTKLIDAIALKEAASKLGIAITEKNGELILSKGRAQVTLFRYDKKSAFSSLADSNRGAYMDDILTPLTQQYGKVLLKKWALKNNYTVSVGAAPDEYVLTEQYK